MLFKSLALASAVGFFALGLLFKRGSTMEIDRKVSEAIVSRRTPALTVVNAVLTALGSALGISGVLLTLRSRLRGKDRDVVDYLIYQTVMLGIINELARLPFGRQRPPHRLYREVFTGYPSAHASAGIAFFGLLAILLLNSDESKWWALPVALFVPAVGFSRVYLGVHWPSDVLAGYFLGGSYLGGSLSVLSKMEKGKAA